MTTLRLMGDNNLVRNNTILKTFPLHSIQVMAIVEYNDLSQTGYLQSDGA